MENLASSTLNLNEKNAQKWLLETQFITDPSHIVALWVQLFCIYAMPHTANIAKWDFSPLHLQTINSTLSYAAVQPQLQFFHLVYFHHAHASAKKPGLTPSIVLL